MFINFVPDLFIEVAELIRFKESLDSNGFRKVLLQDSVNFGLIKSSIDPFFVNAKVERDVDNSLSQKTIKIGPIAAINNQGNLLTLPITNNLPIPSDNSWYWVKISHQYSSIEKGKVSIDATGNLIGINTEFLKVLRSNQNFPSFIEFVGSTNNPLQYELVDVIDNTHAIVAHPAITVGGNADFIAESNLDYAIVGTFTEGVEAPVDNQFPFRYDSCLVSIVAESVLNMRPTYVQGQEFYIARVKVTDGNLVIQDKRGELWETKGSSRSIELDRSNNNPLIGVESVKWQNLFNTGDRNIVDIAWGMRSTNWAVDSSLNIVTLFGSSTGGSFKTIDDFTDGDFNGWRLYTSNGKYSKVVNSIKQGAAINCYLDHLDVDHFSLDGGITFITDTVLIVPDADAVELTFIPEKEINVVDDVFNVDDNDKFIFNINTPIAHCLPTVYKDDKCKYIVLYRYKAFKEFSKWTPIASGSYYTELSFRPNGSLLPDAERIIQTYISSPIAAFIELQISPNSWKRFKETVYKGDIIGVNTISSFVAGQTLELKVGIDKRYQHIVGDISLTDDIYISLSRLKAVEGNEFRLHFDCNSLSMSDKKFIICDDYASGTLIVLKELTFADAFQMKNIDGGLVLDIVYSNEGKWIVYQNYDLGQPFQLKMIDVPANELVTYFDTTSLLGKKKGYFGWALHSTLNSGRVPVGFGTYTDINGTTVFVQGESGGEVKHKQIVQEMPKHRVKLFGGGAGGVDVGVNDTAAFDAGLGGNSSYRIQKNVDMNATRGQSSEVGGDVPFNIMQPYFVTVFVKQMF
jgi:hypothetical protein